MNKKIFFLSIILIISIGICITLILLFYNSPSYGSISGKVKPDKSGIVVDVIHDNKFIAETTTDDDGTYNISNLPEGVYDLAFIFNKDGYYFNGIRVFADNLTLYDVNLTAYSPLFFADQILVKFRKELSEDQKSSIVSMYGCQIMKKENHYDGTYYVLNITTKERTLFEVINQLNNDSHVESATMSYVVRITSP